MAPFTNPESKSISSTNIFNQACPNTPSMFHFLFMNIAHLISKTKQKLKFLADLCDANTLFLCFCETFLHAGIEIQIPGFSITRCDRLSRIGGGVCIYMKKSVNFTTCVNYSNSVHVCELLILKLHTPSIIVILVYRPPSCTINEFDDVIIKINQFIFSLNSPLPNIMILGDFNYPGVNWSSPNLSSLKPLVNLCDSLFLSQQVNRPTRKFNILDIIFCPNELINSIVVSDTFISDHRMITVDTNIPVHDVAPKQIFNPPSNQFVVPDFHKADWPNILLSLQSIDWIATLEPIPPSSCFY